MFPALSISGVDNAPAMPGLSFVNLPAVVIFTPSAMAVVVSLLIPASICPTEILLPGALISALIWVFILLSVKLPLDLIGKALSTTKTPVLEKSTRLKPFAKKPVLITET